MSRSKRITVDLDSDLHRALRLKSAASDVSVSEIVNKAVRLALTDDATDLGALAARRKEQAVDFDLAVRDLRRRNRL